MMFAVLLPVGLYIDRLFIGEPASGQKVWRGWDGGNCCAGIAPGRPCPSSAGSENKANKKTKTKYGKYCIRSIDG